VAKQSGLGDNFFFAGYDLSGDVGSLSRIGGGPALLEVTGINKSGIERIGGLRDGGIEFTAFFNDAAGQAHPVLSALPTTDRIATYCRGTTLGNPAACMVAKQINYDPTRNADGSLTETIQTLANGYGLEWGEQHTAGKRTDTAATNGTGVDGAAATNFGLQAYVQVLSFAGTDATIKLQESSDNGAGDAWADVTGGGFTAITTAPSAERIATATNLAVERYLRVVTTTSAGFTSLVFAVVVVRNATTPVF
jgi:hypothetical protein